MEFQEEMEEAPYVPPEKAPKVEPKMQSEEGYERTLKHLANMHKSPKAQPEEARAQFASENRRLIKDILDSFKTANPEDPNTYAIDYNTIEEKTVSILKDYKKTYKPDFGPFPDYVLPLAIMDLKRVYKVSDAYSIR
jgi:hypothetical protein